MVAYLQIFWQKNAKFFQQCKFRSPEARNSMAIREYKQSSFFLQEKLQMSENCSTFAYAFGKAVASDVARRHKGDACLAPHGASLRGPCSLRSPHHEAVHVPEFY